MFNHNISRRTGRIAAFFLTLFVLLGIPSGCVVNGGKSAPVHLSGVVWGTAYNITYIPTPDVSLEQATAAITEALDAVDTVANAFNPSSEISVFNRVGYLYTPSASFVELIERSKLFNKYSYGAFEPTLAPLVDLWGFGASSKEQECPDNKAIAAAMTKVGLDKIQTTPDGTIKVLTPGVRLDFGAIAKGYGVDKVAAALTRLGIKDYIVEIGGEVRVGGQSPRGDKWAIQIDAPIPDTTGTHTRMAVLTLCEAAVATSGNYRNFRTNSSGQQVYHTISPVTGRPATSDILSATVIASRTADADALATACMVLGLKQASTMITTLTKDPEIGIYGAIFITADKEGHYTLHPVSINTRHATLSD